ncbi:Uncharacterised protein [Vibrio cholerae]|nr:Uncharacterised protein [Vibrio cholerae]
MFTVIFAMSRTTQVKNCAISHPCMNAVNH